LGKSAETTGTQLSESLDEVENRVDLFAKCWKAVRNYLKNREGVGGSMGLELFVKMTGGEKKVRIGVKPIILFRDAYNREE